MMIVVTVLVYFAVLMLLSRWTARRSDNDTFYRGNRQSPWYMVAFGMVGASISGVTFISVPGMVLKMDMTYIQTCLGFILGYAAVAFVNYDVAADTYTSETALASGVFAAYEKPSERTPKSWGALRAWAWGASRVMDWIEDEPTIDASRVAVVGHSRGGKAALCAGIFDDRFAVTAPMGSGCGGAGCARFSGTLALDRDDPAKCETIGRMAHVFPTWMTPRYASYGSDAAPYPIGEEVQAFPLDAHMLRAACAPRAVFNSEGRSDFWANTFGTELCRDAAQKVFEFLGVPERNGFHIRNGGHAFNRDDWSALIDFCDIVLHRVRSMPRADTTNSAYVIDLKQYAPWAEQ